MNILPEAPEKICRMTRKLVRKLNVKNPEAIKVVMHDNMYSIMTYLPFDKEIPGLLMISRHLCDEKFAKEKWKEYRDMCENDRDMASMDLIGNETRELRMVFGLKVPRNYIKFTLAHELAHFKYKDGVVRASLFPCAWMVATIWPATNLVLAKMPQLHSLTYFKCEFVANVIDPLLFLDIVGIGSLWCLSYVLFLFCKRHLLYMYEFRADRTAAEIDVDIAKGGLMLIKGFSMYNQLILRMGGWNQHWGDYDSHQKESKRIKAIEKVIEMHDTKKNTQKDQEDS